MVSLFALIFFLRGRDNYIGDVGERVSGIGERRRQSLLRAGEMPIRHTRSLAIDGPSRSSERLHSKCIIFMGRRGNVIAQECSINKRL
jgi:hypothetical protein